MVALLIFFPFILFAGSIGTLMVGTPVILIIIIWAMIRHDRSWRPALERHPRKASSAD